MMLGSGPSAWLALALVLAVAPSASGVLQLPTRSIARDLDPLSADADGARSLLAMPRAIASTWELYVHAVPWRELGLSEAAERSYRSLIDSPTEASYDEGGLYHHVIADLPKLMPRWTPPAGLDDAGLEAAGRAAQRVLFLLPLSPYHFCRATEHAGKPFGETWMRNKGVLPLSISLSMRDAYKDGLASHVITCLTYERALRWLYAQPLWRAASERHVFALMQSHVARVSLEENAARLGRATTVYAQMGRGILVTAEDRRHDWLEAVRCGHVVLAPYFSPGFFMYDLERDGPLHARKEKLAASSSSLGNGCHRYDDAAKPSKWSCGDFAMQRTVGMRKAIAYALNNLKSAANLSAVSSETRRDAASYGRLEELLRVKADQYKSSLFCIIPPGDSAITTRIFSAVQSLCIPVFLYETLEWMPFGGAIDWSSFSLSYAPSTLQNFRFKRAPNPLLQLRELRDAHPEKVAAMQAALAEARWHLLYHDDGDLPVHYGGPARPAPSAGRTLVAHLVAAAAKRVAQVVTQRNASQYAVLQCVRDAWQAKVRSR